MYYSFSEHPSQYYTPHDCLELSSKESKKLALLKFDIRSKHKHYSINQMSNLLNANDTLKCTLLNKRFSHGKTCNITTFTIPSE